MKVFAAPAFLAVVMSFFICSSLPPSPPSISAAEQHMPFLEGIKKVIKGITIVPSFGIFKQNADAANINPYFFKSCFLVMNFEYLKTFSVIVCYLYIGFCLAYFI